MNRMMHIIAARFCVAASLVIATGALTAQARSLLYYYDFDTLANGGVAYTGTNKGSGTTEWTLKKGSANVPSYTTGAMESSHAFYTSSTTSLWLGDGSTSLGCGTEAGFTIAFWLKVPSSHTSWSDFFGYRIAGRDYRFEYENKSGRNIHIFGSGSSAIISSPISNISAGEWSHVALVFNPTAYVTNNAASVYVNGAKTATVAIESVGNLQQIHLGAWVRHYYGSKYGVDRNISANNTAIDELAVYDYPVTEEHLKWLIQNHPGQPSGNSGRAMPVCWRFDTSNSSQGAYAGNHGTSGISAGLWGSQGKATSSTNGALGSPRSMSPCNLATWRIADSSSGLGASVGSGYTISFWLYAQQKSVNWTDFFTLVSGPAGGSSRNMRFEWDSSSTSILYAFGSMITSDTSLYREVNCWKHVCLVWNAATQSIDYYYDGNFIKTISVVSATSDLDVIKEIMVGGQSVTSTGGWKHTAATGNTGDFVDELALFNYSVSPEQVAWLGANVPNLPPLDVTNLVRTVSADCSWDASLASWSVVTGGVTSTRTTIWPACEDVDVNATVTFSSASTVTNDTFVTCKSLTLLNGTEESTAAPTIKFADGSRFEPQSLTVGDGVQVTMPLYASVSGTLTFGTDSKIIFDTSNYNGDVGGLTAGSFALPDGDSDVLSHFAVTDSRFAVSLSEDGKTVTVALDNVAATATWVGAVDGDLSVASNWECRNGSGAVLSGVLPCEYTRILASGTLNVPEGTTIPWQYLRFEVTNTVALTANCDWRGLGSPIMQNASTVNLGGYKLYTVSPGGAGTVTGEGELHLDVEGTFSNTGLTLSGALTLVKEGAGTYVGALAQTYTGGTLVAEGTARPPDGSGSDVTYSRDSFKAFGMGIVTVSEGATFDIRANYAYYGSTSLDGGTLTNTKADMTGITWGGSGIGTLTKDSTLNVPCNIVYVSSTDLGGNTLTIPITTSKYLYLHNASFTNGTVDITSGGWFRTVTVCDAKTVDFKVNCALYLATSLSVHDYNAVYGYNANDGTAALNVYGTFTPTTDYFYGCTMQDGSTIDLSSRTGVWSTTSAFTSGSKTVTFADNATVKIKLGARVVANGTKIVGWTSEPANLAGLRFKSADGEKFAVVKKDDGLYLLRGLFLVVR